MCARVCFPIYDRLRNNSYINRFDTLSLDENMLLLLGILGGLLLAPGATLFLLYRLCARAFEETKREELQKLVTECAE
jgi:predicted transcriptional regulator